MPTTLTNAAVRAAVRELVSRGQVRWRPHAEEKMAERGYSKDQAKACLLRGSFLEHPTVPNRGGPIQYEFTMTAKVDARAIKVVASLIPNTRVVVISVVDPVNKSWS